MYFKKPIRNLSRIGFTGYLCISKNKTIILFHYFE
jgi:hypothetical protein